MIALLIRLRRRLAVGDDRGSLAMLMLVTLIGVTDMVVVHTPDATMICPKSEAQRVKDLVAKVKEKFGANHL